jgi:2-polyprenyl-3-methyl-5-hydroxy-6-metoxy-1,4-benzoquinol methylase
MLDVIEHLEDPKAALELCGEFLRPSGAVILTTPDFDSALARITGKSWRNMHSSRERSALPGARAVSRRWHPDRG